MCTTLRPTRFRLVHRNQLGSYHFEPPNRVVDGRKVKVPVPHSAPPAGVPAYLVLMHGLCFKVGGASIDPHIVKLSWIGRRTDHLSIIQHPIASPGKATQVIAIEKKDATHFSRAHHHPLTRWAVGVREEQGTPRPEVQITFIRSVWIVRIDVIMRKQIIFGFERWR